MIEPVLIAHPLLIIVTLVSTVTLMIYLYSKAFIKDEITEDEIGKSIEEIYRFFDRVIYSPMNYTTTNIHMWSVIHDSLTEGYIPYINHSEKYTREQLEDMRDYVRTNVISAMKGSSIQHYDGPNTIDKSPIGALFFKTSDK